MDEEEPYVPFRKSSRALAEEASEGTKSFDALERGVYDTITFSDNYDTIVSTRLARAFERAQMRTLVFAIIRVETPQVYWESSVENMDTLLKFRRHFEAYTLIGDPQRLTIEQFLDALNLGAHDTDVRLFSALTNYLQTIHHKFSLYRQSASAQRDPTDVDPTSVLARIASTFGTRIAYTLTEYTLYVDLSLTRYYNNEAVEQAAALRLFLSAATPRDTAPLNPPPVALVPAQDLRRVTSSGSGVLPTIRASSSSFQPGRAANASSSSHQKPKVSNASSSNSSEKKTKSSSSSSTTSGDEVILTTSETLPLPPPATTLRPKSPSLSGGGGGGGGSSESTSASLAVSQKNAFVKMKPPPKNHRHKKNQDTHAKHTW